MPKEDLWKKYRRPAPAKKIVQNEKPSIRIDDDGKAWLKHSWGQELPADHSSLYFWEMLQDITGNLTPEGIQRYCDETTKDAGEQALLCYFAAWLVEEAEKRIEERDKKRENDIREVRREIDLYADEGTTEKELEDDEE